MKVKNCLNNIKSKLKPIDKLTMVFIGILMCCLLGFIFARHGIHNYKQVQVSYKEKSDIHYKVYLKENNFFEEDYLEENRTYITSLIDYLDIDFNYNINLDEKITGNYSYYIKGIISADTLGDNNNSYWSKEYTLTDIITKEYNDSNKIEINEKVRIKYQDYNDLLSSFKQTYGLAMQGNLKIALVVINNITNEILERDIVKETELKLDIPLTSLTIEVPIKVEGTSNEGLLIDETIYNDSIIYIISKIVGYIFFTIATILILYLIYMVVIEIKKESIYHKTLKKILKVYDGIIVNVKEAPKLNNLNVVVVKSFEELIDAHSEVRRPINYIQKNIGATFILISEGIAYKYFLPRELFNNNQENEVAYEE